MNLVFDFGAVLFNWKPAELLAQTFAQEASTPQTAAAMAHALFAHADWHSFDRGTLAMDDVVQRSAARLGLDLARVEALMHHIGGHLAPIPGTVNLLRQLHSQRLAGGDLKLYYLSNMPAPYARRLQELHDFLQCFDGGVFSGDVHWIKPEPQIYQLLQSRYALEPAQTVFIDDLKHNVHAAEQQGWSGIHFHSPEQLEQELVARNIYEKRL
jgi:putative hydrolase of the HAD superfamily